MTVAPSRSRPSGEIGPAWWTQVDYLLIFVVLALCGFGSLMVFSATRGAIGGEIDASYLQRQLAAMVLGVGVGAGLAVVDFRKLLGLASLAYVGLLVLLVGVLAVGVEVNGARAWFQLGSVQLQPSELGKIALILVLASVLGTREGASPRRVGTALALTAVPVGLILLQPDLGTVLVYGAILVVVLVVSGASGRLLGAIGLALVVATVAILGSGTLEEYQVDRLTVFIGNDCTDDTTSQACYNVEQAQVAIGNGGLRGQGLFEGTQTRSEHVPEQQTDFIFTVVGEELGFAGGALLLSLYGVLAVRIWRIANLASDRAGTLVCIGVLAMLVFQMFQSIGMTLGMMPVTGIPLPFVSYGGSSVITALAGIGLVLNVHLRRFS